MRIIKCMIVVVLWCFSTSVFSFDESQLFGRLPLTSEMKISPDGERIGYLQDIDGKYHIVSKSLYDDNEKPVVYTLEGEARIRSLTWGNSHSLLFWASIPYYSPGDYEKFTLWRVGILNVKSRRVEFPFTSTKFNYNVSAPSLVNKLVDDPGHVLLSNYYTGMNRKTISAVYKVNLEDGEREKVFWRPYSGSWVTNRAGEIVAYKEYENEYDQRVWKFRPGADEEFIDLLVMKEEKKVPFEKAIVHISDDRKFIYFYDRNEETIRVISQGEIQGDQVVDIKVVKDFDQYDIDTVLSDAITGLYAGVKYIGEYPESDFNDRRLAKVNADLKATFPDAEIDITSYSQDLNRFIARISGSRYPQQYFFYDKNAGELSMIAEGFPDVSKLGLRQVVNYRYTTSDNLSIDAYLTLPKPSAEGKPPLIVLPHGGPEARVDASFNWERQFFATQGFAVFEPNFRGSSGYGKTFAEAGYGEWGKKMQQDVDEGVAQLIKDGKVDPEKICVVGGSYGGYVAQIGATVRQDLYRCAVSYGGVSDLNDIFFHEEMLNSSIEYWEKSIGKKRDRETLEKHSPRYLVSDSTRPILLFHGENDTIVPPYQSTYMYNILKKAKIEGSRYIKLENEDHWFSNGASRHIYLRESLQFINEQLNVNESVAP